MSMIRRIRRDNARFKQIVRGKIKKNLKKYIRSGEMIGRQGKDLVSIPLPQIDLPRFRYGKNQKDGVGQGEGEKGQAIDQGPQGHGGPGEAGDVPGRHLMEVEVTLDELAQILGEALELPNIEPRGHKNIQSEKNVYNKIRTVGPESLRHFKRTFREALKRQMATGSYDPENPMIVPIRRDKRYRSWTTKLQPQSNAVIIYMIDVSGSMGREQKEIVRIESFWIDTWLRSQYKQLQVRYIVHDAAAKEVDQHTFYHLRESGGTKISSAYSLCRRIIEKDYPRNEWNIYPFHFSDGDNWGGDDTKRCIKLLEKYLLPCGNMFCYGQVKSAYGSGQFKRDLDSHFGEQNEQLITSDIPDRDGIIGSIKDFLGTGR